MEQGGFMRLVDMYMDYENLVKEVEAATGTKHLGLWKNYGADAITFAINGYFRSDNCIHLYKDGRLYHFNNENSAVRQEQTVKMKTLACNLYGEEAQRTVFNMSVNYKGIYTMDTTEQVLQDFDDVGRTYRDMITVVVTHNYNPKTNRYSHSKPRREYYSGLVHANID